MENHISGVKDRIIKKGARVIVPTILFLSAACSSGSPKDNPGQVIGEPATVTGIEMQASPVVESTPQIVKEVSAEEKSILEFANQYLKKPVEDIELTRVVNAKNEIEYSTKLNLENGLTLQLIQTNNPGDNGYKSKCVLVEGFKTADINGKPDTSWEPIGKALSDSFKTVPESGWVQTSTPQGTELFDSKQQDKTSKSSLIYGAYWFHEKGSTASTIGVAVCDNSDPSKTSIWSD